MYMGKLDVWDIDGIAKEIWGEVTPETRTKAKNLTFTQRFSRTDTLRDLLGSDGQGGGSDGERETGSEDVHENLRRAIFPDDDEA